MRTFFNTVVVASCLALFAQAAGQTPKSLEGQTVLVGAKLEQRSLLRARLAKFGFIEGENQDGFVRVRVVGKRTKDALASILKQPGVLGAFEESATAFRSNSLPELQNHMAYLRVRGEMNGTDPKAPNYMRALEHYLRARVGPDGLIDGDKLMAGLEHRSFMPEAPPPTAGALDPNDRETQTIRGGWAFMGPRNIDVPQTTYFGTRPIAGRINAVASHPSNPNRIFVATPRGGVFRTDNGGVTWIPLSDGWAVMHASALAIDPSDPNIIYAGTGDHHGGGLYGVGIMKSTDGGNTWVNHGKSLMSNLAVSEIMINPSQPSQMVVTTGRGTQNLGRVFRSSTSGETWVVCRDTNGNRLPAGNWSGGDWSAPTAPGGTTRNLYVVGGGANGGNLFRSTDWGATWTRMSSPETAGLFQLDLAAGKSTSRPEEVFVIVPETRRIWRSDSRATPWIDITAGFPSAGIDNPIYNWTQPLYNFHITTALTDDGITLVYAGQITVAVNVGGNPNAWTDIGETYQGTAKTHNDQHSCFPHPTMPESAFIGNDGGVYRVDLNVPPGGGTPTVTFTNFNANLPITQFYYVSIHPTDPRWIMGGTQDNATPMSRGDLNNWSNLGQGDGGGSGFVRPNPLRVFISWQGMSVGRSDDGFATLGSNITPDYGSDILPFVGPITMGTGTRANDVLVGTNYLWRYNSNTSTWTPRVGGTELASDGAYITAIDMARTNQNRIYVGSGDSKIWMTTDYGATPFVRIDPPTLPDRWVADIVSKDGASSDVLVAFSGFASDNLWRCLNTDAASPVWVNVSGIGANALPPVPVNAIAIDPFDPGTYYVGTDIGAFMSTDQGQSWLNITRSWDLPNVHVTDLKVLNYGGATYLYAATFGRGIWRVRLRENALNSLDLPASVFGGTSVTGTLYFNGPVGPANITVDSSEPFTAWVDGAVSIPANTASKTFTLQTSPVFIDTNVTLSATYGGETRQDTIAVKMPRLSSVSFNVSRVIGGSPLVVTTRLTSPAFASGIFVSLADQFKELWGYPTSLMVEGGKTTASAKVKTNPVVVDTLVSLNASWSGTLKTAWVTLVPGGLSQVRALSQSVVGGKPFTGEVLLSGPAPKDIVVSLSTQSPFMALPATVTVPQGQSSKTFNANTTPVPQQSVATIDAAWGNTTRKANITLLP